MRLLVIYIPVYCVNVCLYGGGGLGVGWVVFNLYAVKLTAIVVLKFWYFWCVICVL